MASKELRIRVPASALPGLRLMAKHSKALLALVSPEAPLSLDAMAQLVVAEGGLSHADARRIVNVGVQLSAIARHYFDRSPGEVYDAITRSLEESGQWTEEDLQSWLSAREQVTKILRPDHGIALLQRILDLSYDHQNILRDTRILTDVRPVFSESAESIRHMVVTQMLVIQYTEAKERKEIHLALDSRDVAALRDVCERAETKARVLKGALTNAGWLVAMGGDE